MAAAPMGEGRLKKHLSVGAIPLCYLLYGTSSQLTHNFPGREAEVVEFIDCFSQGFPSGNVLIVLGLYFCLHLILT